MQTLLIVVLLLIAGMYSSLSQSAVQTLQVSVGGEVSFPASVLQDGFLLFGKQTIAHVSSGNFVLFGVAQFTERLQWNKVTGLFKIQNLNVNDSGEYTVQNTESAVLTTFKLMVSNNESPSLSIGAKIGIALAVCILVVAVIVGLILWKIKKNSGGVM